MRQNPPITKKPAAGHKTTSKAAYSAAALLCVGMILLGGLAWRNLTIPRRPPACPSWITQDYLPINPYSRPGTELEKIQGIVVHYVGNPGTTAEQNRDYFASLAQTGETYASSHFLIGLDGEIIQAVPLDEVAYCSNRRNGDTISIECCHPGADGAFTDETYRSLIKLVNWLRDYYRLGTDQVIRHYDVTGKECPRYYVIHPEAWEKFLDDLKSE